MKTISTHSCIVSNRCFSALSDSEERCRAPGVCHHVQCGTVKTVLPPVHCAQHGRTAGIKVRTLSHILDSKWCVQDHEYV